MQKRFESDLSFQATLLLLQERIPKATAFYSHATEPSGAYSAAHDAEEKPARTYTSPHTPIPEVQLLSNGRYHVMVTNAGGGYSRWKDLAVTRWREDSTCDNWGTFCYIRDEGSGVFWSTAHQPTLRTSEQYEAVFSEGRAEFRRRDDGFDTHTEIAVSPEDDIELRRITITNHARTAGQSTSQVTPRSFLHRPLRTRSIQPSATSLCRPRSSIEGKRIFCTRRPRSVDEQTPWMFHLMAVHGADIGETSYETDRMRFIGRGNSLCAPAAMRGGSRTFGQRGAGARSHRRRPVSDNPRMRSNQQRST